MLCIICHYLPTNFCSCFVVSDNFQPSRYVFFFDLLNCNFQWESDTVTLNTVRIFNEVSYMCSSLFCFIFVLVPSWIPEKTVHFILHKSVFHICSFSFGSGEHMIQSFVWIQWQSPNKYRHSFIFFSYIYTSRTRSFVYEEF